MVWRHVLSPWSLLKDWRKLLRLASASIHERKVITNQRALWWRREKKNTMLQQNQVFQIFSCVLRVLIYQKAIRIPKEQCRYVLYVNDYFNPLFCNAFFWLKCFLVSIAKKKKLFYYFWWRESIKWVYIWDKLENTLP